MCRRYILFPWGVERPILRNFEISSIKIMKDELLDFFIIEFTSLMV